MAVWSVKPDWKKSIIERQIWTKEGVAGYISHEIGWRWGEFTVTTDDDTPPNLEEGVDIYSCGYDAELIELNDGCWEESDVDVQDEELRNELETFIRHLWLYLLYVDGLSWLSRVLRDVDVDGHHLAFAKGPLHGRQAFRF